LLKPNSSVFKDFLRPL